MKRAQRFLSALAISGLLGVGLISSGATVTVYASSPATVDRTNFCSALADYIAKLQALPPGPLRDLLLKVAQAVATRYCD